MHKAGRAFVDMRGKGLETVSFLGGRQRVGGVSCKSEVYVTQMLIQTSYTSGKTQIFRNINIKLSSSTP